LVLRVDMKSVYYVEGVVGLEGRYEKCLLRRRSGWFRG